MRDFDTTDREHSVDLAAQVEGEDGLHFCIDQFLIGVRTPFTVVSQISSKLESE